MSGTYRIKLKKRGDVWVAVGSISLGPGYTLKAVAKISEKAVAKTLAAAARGMRGTIAGDGQDQELGWGFFKKIYKAAKKVTKKIARSKVLGKIAKIAPLSRTSTAFRKADRARERESTGKVP